jgi:hypothetical protein
MAAAAYATRGLSRKTHALLRDLARRSVVSYLRFVPAASRLLSSAADRVLVAAVAAIRPRGHGFDQPIDDDVLARVRAFFPFLPPPLRRAFPLGLRALEWAPLVVSRRRQRFSTLPPDEARRVLERLNDLGGPFGALVLGLRTLVFLAFYQHADVLRALEVDWAGRAAELTRRRAGLLAS